MQSRFTKKAEEALVSASEVAAELKHSYVGTEHILIGLIRTQESLASAVLLKHGVTDEKVIELVNQLIAPEGAVNVKDPHSYTPRAVRILENAEKESE